MGSLSVWHWLIVAFYIALLVVPIARILGKAGFSGWWSLLAILPIVNIICLWVFAFVRWPMPDAQPQR